MKNESKLETRDFFAKLKQDAELDPKNFKVRDVWVRDGNWCGEYLVVFGRHFSVRAWQRLNAGDIVAAVMHQLSNNEVAKAITDHPVFWDHGEISVGEDGFDSVAVIEDGVPFVVIYECGDSYICPKTVLVKNPDMFVMIPRSVAGSVELQVMTWIDLVPRFLSKTTVPVIS